MLANEWRKGRSGGRAAWLCVCLATALGACAGRQADMPSVPEDCATPGDEDGNGLADCEDPACGALPACQPVCGNAPRRT